MTTFQQPDTRPLPTPLTRLRFVSLRTKFVVFFSLILILACSTLSWYLIENRRAAMINNLQQLGTILLTNVVSNEHFQYAGVVLQDPATLQEFVDGLMAVQDVVYVVVTGSDGAVLTQRTKGARRSSASLQRSTETPLYPESRIAQTLLQSPVTAPQMIRLSVANKNSHQLAWEELVYDFAMPVMRMTQGKTSMTPFTLGIEEGSPHPPSAPPLVSGIVQIGLSDAHLKYELLAMVSNVILLTVIIIFAGILGAHLLTTRITTPLRKLATVAQRLAEGDIPPPLSPVTSDEVGRLTGMFNMMTRALHERNVSITTNLAVIKRQVSQLSAVHETSAAITSTLDLNQLLDTVLQLLVTNLGFTRMLLMLRRDDRETAYVAQVAGVSPDISTLARRLEIPVQEGDTLIAELLLQAKPVLVTDIDSISRRMHPTTLALTRQVGVTSFVAVPLQSHSRTLGFLAGDRGTLVCTSDDLSILITIAGHVAAAIDNARAYGTLAELTQHLEERIRERTRELSLANERLQDHDRRRSMFVSVASHELRTPMTVIRSFVDNMRDGITGPLTERQSTYLSRIGHNLDRLARIINQLLDWSRLDLKKDVLRLEPLCIRQIAALVAESFDAVALKKQITIDVKNPAALPAVQGDRDKLEQIVWNLIGNAVRFTPPEGRITIEFETTQDGYVQVCVADTGCGIQPEHFPKLFNEFSKVPSPVPNAQGAQLGLWITKSLITMHQGHIRVESTPGVGTRFFFTLPIAESQPDASEALRQDSSVNIERCEP